MAAYVIADIEVHDPDGYAEYRARAPAVIAAYGGRYIARGGTVEAIEGDWSFNRCVILEFPDMAHLKDFINSPEYAPLRSIRERTAHSKIVAVEGYTP